LCHIEAVQGALIEAVEDVGVAVEDGADGGVVGAIQLDGLGGPGFGGEVEDMEGIGEGAIGVEDVEGVGVLRKETLGVRAIEGTASGGSPSERAEEEEEGERLTGGRSRSVPEHSHLCQGIRQRQ
jgi:hypothetical protein